MAAARDAEEATHSTKPWWLADKTPAFGPVDRFLPNRAVPSDDDPGCGHYMSRDAMQAHLSELNPEWQAWAERLQANPELRMRRNPDGDIQLEGVDYYTFEFPPCPSCGGVLKPDVTFFGENVRSSVRKAAEQAIHECDALLVVGTTLATHSAFRLVRDAIAAAKPVVLVNRGPTRADDIVEDRLGVSCAEVMPAVADHMLGTSYDA